MKEIICEGCGQYESECRCDKKPYMEKYREEIFGLVTDPPCRKCDFWDVKGHYCWLRNMYPDSKKCELLGQIITLLQGSIEDAKKHSFDEGLDKGVNAYILGLRIEIEEAKREERERIAGELNKACLISDGLGEFLSNIEKFWQSLGDK
jgi:hypothetical protein